jgi:hypothetical protein
METRTQIVTQLVAAMISSGIKSDKRDMIRHALEIADVIIQNTYPEEIAFPETVV